SHRLPGCRGQLPELSGTELAKRLEQRPLWSSPLAARCARQADLSQRQQRAAARPKCSGDSLRQLPYRQLRAQVELNAAVVARDGRQLFGNFLRLQLSGNRV